MLEMSYFTSIGLHIQLFILDFTFCLCKLTTANHLLLSQVLNYNQENREKKVKISPKYVVWGYVIRIKYVLTKEC